MSTNSVTLHLKIRWGWKWLCSLESREHIEKLLFSERTVFLKRQWATSSDPLATNLGVDCKMRFLIISAYWLLIFSSTLICGVHPSECWIRKPEFFLNALVKGNTVYLQDSFLLHYFCYPLLIIPYISFIQQILSSMCQAPF